VFQEVSFTISQIPTTDGRESLELAESRIRETPARAAAARREPRSSWRSATCCS